MQIGDYEQVLQGAAVFMEPRAHPNINLNFPERHQMEIKRTKPINETD